MKVHRAAHSIATLCRVLEVSPSGYYAWHRRTASQRAHEDASLTAEIEAIHRHSRGVHRAAHSIATLCRVLEASPSGYAGTDAQRVSGRTRTPR